MKSHIHQRTNVGKKELQPASRIQSLIPILNAEMDSHSFNVSWSKVIIQNNRLVDLFQSFGKISPLGEISEIEINSLLKN